MYDSVGQDSLVKMPSVEANMYYSLVFGSEKFEHLIGELKIATQVGQGVVSVLRSFYLLLQYVERY